MSNASHPPDCTQHPPSIPLQYNAPVQNPDLRPPSLPGHIAVLYSAYSYHHARPILCVLGRSPVNQIWKSDFFLKAENSEIEKKK